MKSGSYAAIALAVGLSLGCGTASAQQIYNNWNTEACGFTDRAGFRLREPTRLTAIELWYRWGPRESEVGFEVLIDGRPVKEGRLMRADCDPYQEAWCGARGNVGVSLPPGYVEIHTERGKICQNPRSGGAGFIHAYGLER